MNNTEPQSFEQCRTEDEARELIAQRYNNTVVEAMDAGFSPMFVAQLFRDFSGATVVELYRQQDDRGGDKRILDNSKDHPLK